MAYEYDTSSQNRPIKHQITRPIPKDTTRAGLLDRKQTLFRDALGPPVKGFGTEWRAQAKQHNGLSMAMSGAKEGQWKDHRTGRGGDILDFFAVYNCGLKSAGEDFPTVIEIANRYCGLTSTTDFPQKQPDTNTQSSNFRDTKAEIVVEIKASCRPLNTPAEVYLTRRCRSKETTLEFIPSKSGGGCIVAWATDATGKPRGGQRIFLNSKGEKHTLSESQTSKLSFGSISGFPVRFPANERGNQTLYIAEGIETALSLKEATGCETWAVLGVSFFQTAPIPKHRKIIFCPDRDAPESNAAHGFREAIKDHLKNGNGENLWIAEAIDEPVGSKADFNDTHQRLGLEVVQNSLKQAVRAKYWAIKQDLVPLYHEIPKDSLEDANRKMQESANSWYEHLIRFQILKTQGLPSKFPPEVHIQKTTTGTGKSRLIRRTVVQFINEIRAKEDNQTIAIVVPRHNLAEEYLEKFRQINEADHLRIEIYRGREQQDPEAPEEKMCRRFEEALAIGKNGLSVEENLCKKGKTTCEFYNICGYRKQRKKIADIWLATQPLLYFKIPKCFGDLTGVVIDEDPFNSCFRGFDGKGSNLSCDSLQLPPVNENMTDEAADTNEVLSKIARVCKENDDGFLKIDELNHLPINQIKEAIKTTLKCQLELGITPAASKEKIIEAAFRIGRHNGILMKIRVLLNLILDEIEPLESSNVYIPAVRIENVETEAGLVKTIKLRWTKKIHQSWQVPTLIASGTINPNLTQHLFPNISDITTVDVKSSHTIVRQIIDAAHSKTALCDDSRTQLKSILQYIEVRAAESKTRCLIVAQKEVIERICEYSNLPRNVVTPHFNNLSGLDEWGDIDRQIIIGRPEATPIEVELRAEALGKINVEHLTDGYLRKPAALTMADGSIGPEVYVKQGQRENLKGTPYHPNSLAEDIRAHITNGELLQALGRGRAIRRTAENPLEIDILTNIPLPIGVDQVAKFKDLKPNLYEVMAARGVILRDPSQRGANPIISAILPDLFSTSEAVKIASYRGQFFIQPSTFLKGTSLAYKTRFKGSCSFNGYDGRIKNSALNGWTPAIIKASRYTVDVCLKATTKPEAERLCKSLNLDLINFSSPEMDQVSEPEPIVIIEQSRMLLALQRSKVVPVTAIEATRIFPDIWKNQNVAQKDKDLTSCRKNDLQAVCLQKMSKRNSLVLCTYRKMPENQSSETRKRLQHKAIVHASPEKAIEVLTAVVGPVRQVQIEALNQVAEVLDGKAEREAIQKINEDAKPLASESSEDFFTSLEDFYDQQDNWPELRRELRFYSSVIAQEQAKIEAKQRNIQGKPLKST